MNHSELLRRLATQCDINGDLGLRDLFDHVAHQLVLEDEEKASVFTKHKLEEAASLPQPEPPLMQTYRSRKTIRAVPTADGLNVYQYEGGYMPKEVFERGWELVGPEEQTVSQAEHEALQQSHDELANAIKRLFVEVNLKVVPA